ncbi:MAG: 2OG-Fe(II) oxygenase [Hyphomonadaceae bacterium]|nr:2OG-Fe(II) oxygenase [Hyphomonadaceae bacterium]
MTAIDVETLRSRAAQGDGDAQMALARVFDREGRHDLALQWLQRAADGGHLPSLTLLGARLLTGRGAPQMPSQGVQMLAIAADEGDAQACGIMAVLCAAGQMRPQSWSAALDYLFRAARQGDERARQQIGLLVGDAGLGEQVRSDGAAAPWTQARVSIDVGAWLRSAPPRAVSDAPRIFVFEQFLPKAVCAWIMERARPKLSPAQVQSPAAGDIHHGHRTNSGMGFTLLETDVIVQLVQARIAMATGIPVTHQEPANVLHYAPGQSYQPHYDFTDPAASPQFAEMVRREGQRVATFIVYLNDGYGGGETDFPHIGLRHRGQAGDAILFMNVDPAGAVDKRTLHAGLAPTSGEKWVLSKWIRDRPRAQF